MLLRELQQVQKERLSAKQPPNIICLLVPTAKELQLGTHKHTIWPVMTGSLLSVFQANTNIIPVSWAFTFSLVSHYCCTLTHLWVSAVLITSNHTTILIAAEKVTGNLAHLTSQVTPGDVCSLYGIRKAMGISLPNDTTQDMFTHLTTGKKTNEQ